MTSASAALDAFLDAVAGAPFVDGEADCALTVADWVRTARGGEDPAQCLRGRYRSPEERQALLKRLGGLKAVMTDAATRSGLQPTRTPGRGDVGLVILSGQLLAAICLGGRWAAKGDGLVVETPRRIVKAWRV